MTSGPTSSAATSPSVGFVGAGSMGAPMVTRLLGAGHRVRLYARRQEVRARFSDAGATVVDRPAAVAPTAAVVILCVYSDDQVRDVCLDGGLIGAMQPGSVLALHTTGSPATARELAAIAAERSVGIVDAPVSGSAEDIADGRLTVMLGGAAADTAAVRHLVSAYAGAVFETGELGSALSLKLINNALFAAHARLAVEAAGVASRLGIDVGRLVDVVRHSSGHSYALDALGALGSADALVTAAGPYMSKDVALVQAVADELGLDLGLLGVVAGADGAPWQARVGNGRDA